ncbi:MAG: hypothetical protein K6T83_23060 [Alicyclobacillus sp.]|nr:hypothetical protein [Alicyclobacillus sp.]
MLAAIGKRVGIGVVLALICVVISFATGNWSITTNWLGVLSIVLVALGALPLVGLYNPRGRFGPVQLGRADDADERFNMGINWTTSALFVGLPMMVTAVLTYLLRGH